MVDPVVDHPFPSRLCDALILDMLKNPPTGAWLVLMVATVITWYLGEVGAAGTSAIVAMLAHRLRQGRLVILDFMELREARGWLAHSARGWLYTRLPA